MNKIKLYMETTKKTPEETLSDIQKLLKQLNVTNILINYSNGEISGVSFILITKNNVSIPYKLPIRHDKLWKMSKEGKLRYIKDEQQARKVAWRQTYKWLESQLSLILIEMVSVEEVFLPYMLITDTETVYDKFINGGFAGYLNSGDKNGK